MLAGVLANIAGPRYLPDPSLYDFAVWAADVAVMFANDWWPVATEERWHDWADYLSSTPTGLQYGLPGASEFQNWRDWATRVLQIVG
jgi:hypothetical protein